MTTSVTKATSQKVVSSQTMATSSVKTMKSSTSTVKKSTFSSDGQSSTSVQSSSHQAMSQASSKSVQQSGLSPDEMQKLLAAAGTGGGVISQQSSSSAVSSRKVSQSMQSYTSSSTTSSGVVNVQNLGQDFLASAQKDFEKMKLDMKTRMQKLREEFNLMSLTAGQPEIIKLNSDNIHQFTDKSAAEDKLKFNFDVSEMQSETIDVKCDGNKIEVKAKKMAKSGDDESTEEFSRTYELPQGSRVNPESVSSSFFKDGVLTVELPKEACQDLKLKTQ